MNRSVTVEPLILEPEFPGVTLRRPKRVARISPLEATPTFSSVVVTRRYRVEVPQRAPTTRSFTPPRHATTTARAQSGNIVTRIWASQPGGGSLRLTYENIPDSDAEKLAQMADASRGRRYSLILPASFFWGMHPSLQSALKLNGLPLKWAFKQPPIIQSIMPGVSSIELEFTARGYGTDAITIASITREPFVAQISPLVTTPVFPTMGTVRTGGTP